MFGDKLAFPNKSSQIEDRSLQLSLYRNSGKNLESNHPCLPPSTLRLMDKQNESIKSWNDHYEVEAILQSRQTKNCQGIQYLVKWKGYPDSDNSWEPASHMKNTLNLVTAFHKRYPHFPQPSNTAGAVRP